MKRLLSSSSSNFVNMASPCHHISRAYTMVAPSRKARHPRKNPEVLIMKNVMPLDTNEAMYYAGSIVQVDRYYMRHILYPTRVAVYATEENINKYSPFLPTEEERYWKKIDMRIRRALYRVPLLIEKPTNALQFRDEFENHFIELFENDPMLIEASKKKLDTLPHVENLPYTVEALMPLVMKVQLPSDILEDNGDYMIKIFDENNEEYLVNVKVKLSLAALNSMTVEA